MTRSEKRLQVVSLDVDGTLYSIRHMVLGHLPTFLALRGLFRGLHQVREELRGQEPVADLRAVEAQRLGRVLGLPTHWAAARIEEGIDRRWMQLFSRLEPFAGVRESLRALAVQGVRLAVVSDYPAWPKLGGLGLAQLPWAAVINTEEIGALKPHPAAFSALAERLGVAPGRVLHVGDLEHADIDGARAAGMLCARFYEGRRRPRTWADFAFRDWHRFLPLLRLFGLLG